MVKKRIILLVALLVLLALIIVFRKSTQRKAKVAPLFEAPSMTEEKKPPPAPEEAFAPVEIRRVKGSISWGRDPFLSPLVKGVPEEGVPKAGALILTGIVCDEKGAQAIIGDYIVNVGDIINGKRVISIKKNKVVLMKGKERETLKLEEE